MQYLKPGKIEKGQNWVSWVVLYPDNNDIGLFLTIHTRKYEKAQKIKYFIDFFSNVDTFFIYSCILLSKINMQ